MQTVWNQRIECMLETLVDAAPRQGVYRNAQLQLSVSHCDKEVWLPNAPL